MTDFMPTDAALILAELAADKPRRDTGTSTPDDDRLWLADFRAQTHRLARLSGPPDPAVGIEHVVGPRGVILRLYTPRRLKKGVLIHVRGGGGVAGSLDDHDPALRLLAAETSRKVIAPDYRLAPSSPFPAQLEDARGALEWALSKPNAFVEDQPLFISGDSIGGALAAAIAHEDAQTTRALAGQILMYPNTDLRRDAAWPSRAKNDGNIIDLSDLDRQIDLYLGQTPRDDPRASPLLVDTLRRGVEAFIVTCGLDPLEDEALAFISRLKQMKTRSEETMTLLSALTGWLDTKS
ncbi:hypothetical protein LTR94_024244 [Friedmanniomyces endolithicus]|nr:hypothetical protein LTR94_024244 [Friedmanniomyces endolithicus]